MRQAYSNHIKPMAKPMDPTMDPTIQTPPSASRRQAWRRKCLKCHPDKQPEGHLSQH